MRVLVLTHRLPFAPNRGDRIRAYHLLRHVAAFAEVDLVSLVHDAEEASQAGALEALGIRTRLARVGRAGNYLRGALALPGPAPLTHCLLDSPAVAPAIGELAGDRPPDVVLAYCSGMARFALAPPLDAVPLVLDMVDVDSAKWATLAGKGRPPVSWIYGREHRTLSAFERRAARAAATTLVVNERERDLLLALAPQADVRVVPNGVDVARFHAVQPPSSAPVAVFTGVMDYPPNIEAAVWLAREVWPHVLAARPEARLQIVGASPAPGVRALAGAAVEVTGMVPDTRPYLWGASVAVAPLHTARGIQNKVLEAVAAGLPVVVTPVVADGLPAEVMPACVVGDTAAHFAAHVLDLLAAPPAGRRAMAAAASLAPLGWSERLAPLQGILKAAAAADAPRVRRSA